MIQLFFSALFFVNLPVSEVSPSNKRIITADIKSAPSKTLFTTDWEAATAWNRVEDKTSNTTYYIHQRTFPAEANVSDKGLVLVFTKGYSLSNGPEKPMGLPFTYFPSDVSPKGYSWYQQTKEGGVEVQLNVPASLETNFTTGKSGIHFRYFVMSPQFFEEKKMTPAEVKSLSYKKIVELLGTPE